jgi:hypothetical protein
LLGARENLEEAGYGGAVLAVVKAVREKEEREMLRESELMRVRAR